MRQECAGMGSPGWRRRIRDALAPSPAALGRFQIVTLLPAVNAPLAALVGALVVVGALLPLGVTLATGVLVGAVPPTLTQGFDSPSGRRAGTAGGPPPRPPP